MIATDLVEEFHRLGFFGDSLRLRGGLQFEDSGLGSTLLLHGDGFCFQHLGFGKTLGGGFCTQRLGEQLLRGRLLHRSGFRRFGFDHHLLRTLLRRFLGSLGMADHRHAILFGLLLHDLL